MKTLTIAHRGYSQFERENTLVSFTAAGAQKAFYGIETDVHVTKDGHYVVIHDETTSRVSNDIFNINVEESTYEEVKQVYLPDLDGSTTRFDLRIPELIDYLKICKKYNKVAVLELKQVFSEKQIKQILKIIKEVGMTKKMVIISFIIEDLIAVRKFNKTMKLQWLLCKYEDRHIETCKKYHFDLDVNWPTIDEAGIKLCHENGIKVNVWTINDEEVAKKYSSWGVDFITSNFISKIKR